MAAPKKIVDTITKETFFEEIKIEVEKIEVEFEEVKKALTSEIETLKTENEKLKTELSEAAAKPITFNPEKKNEVAKELTPLEAHKLYRQKIKNNQ